jgi:hypothetical protein
MNASESFRTLPPFKKKKKTRKRKEESILIACTDFQEGNRDHKIGASMVFV